MKRPIVQTNAIVKRYGRKKALDEFTIEINEGGIHAVVGSNGAGKSTLFRLLLGFVTPTSGSAFLFDEESRTLSPQVRGNVCYVNEEHTLPGWMSARQVTEFQKSYYPRWNQQIYDFVIGHFDVGPTQRVSALSRGERAGLNLAIAFAQRPKLVILDEPTLGLDVVAKQSFLETVMFTEARETTTIIYCSHQMDEVERVADHLVIMEKGKLLNNSSPDAFVARVSRWIVEYEPQSPPPTPIPGHLSTRIIDGLHHIMVVDQGEEICEHFRSNGAVEITRSTVNLAESVNALLARTHDTPGISAPSLEYV